MNRDESIFIGLPSSNSASYCCLEDQGQNNIEVPKPPVSSADANIRQPSCADVNAPLLDIIKELTDQDSANNEVKYEQDHKLTADKIYERRMSIIKAGVGALKAHKEGK